MKISLDRNKVLHEKKQSMRRYRVSGEGWQKTVELMYRRHKIKKDDALITIKRKLDTPEGSKYWRDCLAGEVRGLQETMAKCGYMDSEYEIGRACKEIHAKVMLDSIQATMESDTWYKVPYRKKHGWTHLRMLETRPHSAYKEVVRMDTIKCGFAFDPGSVDARGVYRENKGLAGYEDDYTKLYTRIMQSLSLLVPSVHMRDSIKRYPIVTKTRRKLASFLTTIRDMVDQTDIDDDIMRIVSDNILASKEHKVKMVSFGSTEKKLFHDCYLYGYKLACCELTHETAMQILVIKDHKQIRKVASQLDSRVGDMRLRYMSLETKLDAIMKRISQQSIMNDVTRYKYIMYKTLSGMIKNDSDSIDEDSWRKQVPFSSHVYRYHVSVGVLGTGQ